MDRQLMKPIPETEHEVAAHAVEDAPPTPLGFYRVCGEQNLQLSACVGRALSGFDSE
jgi:hypothetical protein